MKYLVQWAAVGAVSILGLAGVAHLVQADQPNSLKAQTVRSTDSKEDIREGNDLEKPETSQNTKTPQSTNLKALAKITPQQAQRSAESAQGAKASDVSLENEDGNLIYAVTIGQTEVAVDAGNGRVLYTEVNGSDSEQAHPHSSIQVSAALGDGDGETRDDG